MKGRIDRKGDKKVYQPPLRSDMVHKLHVIKTETGIPMTVHIHKAVKEYVQNYQTGQVDWIEDQPWEEHLEEIETLNKIDGEIN